ncbi:MAG: hypothetical protein ACUVTW_14615 [Thermogutta sp.]
MAQAFHNLRSSRQTQLDAKFPAHVVCDWLGNSERIAALHYPQTTEEHFDRAVGRAAQQRAVRSRLLWK